MKQLRDELVPRIKVLVPRATATRVKSAAELAAAASSKRPGSSHRLEAVVIGASTGGPNALESVFGSLTRPLAVPVFIVQHIPPVFSRLLAERLDRQSPMHIVEAADGMIAEPGTAYLAPGGFHLTVVRQGTQVICALTEDPQVNSCRPSVDVLFGSSASVYGANQLGVILTGMGHDGLDGCRTLRELGAPILSQDQETSVVWGMPAAVTEAGYADEVLPIQDVADRISVWVRAGSAAIAGSI